MYALKARTAGWQQLLGTVLKVSRRLKVYSLQPTAIVWQWAQKFGAHSVAYKMYLPLSQRLKVCSRYTNVNTHTHTQRHTRTAFIR